MLSSIDSCNLDDNVETNLAISSATYSLTSRKY
uniref:Uncharacterized protein n=1 Tax=Phage sp. ct17O1 TaxID=2825789 RepID=A0A8S5PLR0_9VIRU|nr:MAG TPA: hypothetical protein [Phage sp. ct17O1]